ncbi:hypothetical protein OIU77_020590 [Salix suchowensis]|uniref:Protein kinase domain-containing protein n=1 Tax=Salix suchowensis TaxID=1278906 RepID=A0ABQ9C6Y4_9ROSI|nr:hypothetical protein OIU77_020590 [Salix suchowensis]
MLDHPNIVNLVEVIDDPNTDHFYMVLEYVDGKRVWEGSGPPGGIGEDTARMYLRDIVSGLMYLHAHNIVHGDIKPDNVLVTRSGTVKIGDFSISQVVEMSVFAFACLHPPFLFLLAGALLEVQPLKMLISFSAALLHATLLLDHRTHLANYDKDDNDELRRSPGTPVFTAPECCLGVIYHGKAADTWAVGVTLYCMILGQYPFLGETLHDTYDKIVNNPLVLPDEMNAELKDLLEGLLCKDPALRITLDAVTNHTWVIGDDGPIPQYLCWCKRSSMQKGREPSDGSNDITGINLTE